ncbi:Receptor-type guanylate cyclase gcy [Seminavis robusta]|uniref:adenylate cyclase n=1 Tax=Seminavis robusta TaxID=568900 RepID=A0A9N8HMF4_9STRA|nr:Receptor-type guanylate cyclase gcy [Seminavis robusta]|eukprot:Sro894_g217110.1 Receptor-type guanylate cyclase gcy (1159) ;mRNA; r:8813-12918
MFKPSEHLRAMDDHDESSLGSDSSSSSGIDPSSLRSSSIEKHEDEPDESKQRVAKTETRHVLYSKILVGIVLCASAAFAGVFTYKFISNQETAEFQQKYEYYADELISVSETKATDAFLHLATFGVEITSLASYGGMQWPFVTVDDYHVRASDFGNLTGAIYATICPIIEEPEREAWVNYSLTESNKEWLHEGYDYLGITDGDDTIVPFLFNFDAVNGTIAPVTEPGLVTTLSQIFPTTNAFVNFNLDSMPVFAEPKRASSKARRGILTALDLADVNMVDFPTSLVFEPIMESFAEDDSAAIVAYLLVHFPWNIFFDNVLSDDSHPVQVVVSNECGGVFTLAIVGANVEFLGHADLHDPSMNEWVVTSPFAKHSNIYPSATEADGESRCLHHLYIYPSSQMKADYETWLPITMSIFAILIFALVSLVFISYDFILQRQNRKVAETVQRSNELVTGLFPKEYRERLFGKENGEEGVFLQKTRANKSPLLASRRGESLFADRGDGPEMYTTPPVADLFSDCTVMEADIAGFTAWSSTREPTMVFELLETLYRAFDEIAERRRVFKVETIGDSYVAVAGLPTPRRDHAIIMARFAHDCLMKMVSLTNELEVRLGPGTAALSMRVGLHSGQVTAGVLRGDNLRFQLFGDTLETTELLEQKGGKNKIHISEETAELLRAGGKPHWLQPREEKIAVRSKGMVQSYWVFPKNSSDASSTYSGSSFESPNMGILDNKRKSSSKPLLRNSEAEVLAFTDDASADQDDLLDLKTQRLVDWNVQILSRLLKQVMAKRQAAGTCESSEPLSEEELATVGNGKTPLDEVKEIVQLPIYCAATKEVNYEDVELIPVVKQQLHTLVYSFASWYRDENAFHSFEHASHVTLSVTKLLSRIVRPEAVHDSPSDDAEAKLHDHTYGLTSDPLTQFAVVLSALIHDLDHPGVPNATLVKEATELAGKYKNKSVAEQHSVDLAWELLMSDKYKELRSCIYTTQAELERFRSIIINVVLATDIADKDLGALRKARWNRAFKLGDATDHSDENPKDEVDRKATIVLEHLIQASDIAHTMQHWHVFRKWNERLFQEMYQAYTDGRSDTNPCSFWYEGEIGFFDFYIIPLAKKLKDCGVFGVSSAEYLDYALANREEWVQRGRDVVAEYETKFVNVTQMIDV